MEKFYRKMKVTFISALWLDFSLRIIGFQNKGMTAEIKYPIFFFCEPEEKWKISQIKFWYPSKINNEPGTGDSWDTRF